jgi:hypothetical protein
MPIDSLAIGDLIRVTVVKYLATNPELKWGNNYEFRAKIAASIDEVNALGLTVVAFERQFHLTTVQFDRIRSSTWEPDSVPYDPAAFVSLPLAAAGVRPVGSSNAVALNVCLSLGRIPATGRFGHLFYRGSLREEDVHAPAGKFTLSDPAAVATEVTNALFDTTEFGALVDGTDTDFELVMVGATEATARRVISIQRRGVAVVPYNHAWFNRTAP